MDAAVRVLPRAAAAVGERLWYFMASFTISFEFMAMILALPHFVIALVIVLPSICYSP